MRIAAVGLGWVTLHRHLPAIRASGMQLVGLVDRRGGHAAQLAGKLRVLHSHEGERLGGIPWLDEVDAFSIGTNPHSHGALVREALQLGRHVITEKPFTLELDEAEALVRLAQERGRTLAIVHNFQFARSMRRLQDDLRRGRLGELRFIHARQLGNPRRRLPEWHEQLPLGLFYDESPHMLYLLRALAPPPLEFLGAEVHSSTLGKATPAWIAAHYAAGPNRIPVKLDMAFEAPLSEWHVSVAGERALGDVDVFRDIYMRLPNDGSHTAWPVLRTSLAATASHWLQHLVSGPAHLTGRLAYGTDEVFRRFAAAAPSGTQAEGIGPEDALAVLRMQHQIIARCAQASGRP